eukprot:3161905-Prymnesium_polylepis.1
MRQAGHRASATRHSRLTCVAGAASACAATADGPVWGPTSASSSAAAPSVAAPEPGRGPPCALEKGSSPPNLDELRRSETRARAVCVTDAAAAEASNGC